MTHWLEFGEADFDTARAAKGQRRPEGQGALFFVRTAAKERKSAARDGQLPGQEPLFGDGYQEPD